MAGRAIERDGVLKTAWKLIGFDFDGVIADSMPGQERAWRQAVRAIIRDPDVERRVVENLYDGKAGSRMFDGLDLDRSVTSNVRTAKDRIWTVARDSTPLMTDAASVLALIAGSHVVAVATTADRDYVVSLLSRGGVLASISKIVTDRDVQNPKPAPDMLLHLMREFRIEANSTCMVGDSRADYEMSRAAGVDFIRFASHPRGADIEAPVVSTWTELSALLLSARNGAPG